MRLCSKCKSQPVFSTDKITGFGYCKSHTYLRTDRDTRTPLQKALDKAKTENKVVKLPRFQRVAQTPAEKEIIEISPVSVNFGGGSIEISEFWRRAAAVIALKPYCWSCGDFISKEDYRNSTAHIFPKAIFKSVAYNEWNYLVLGCRCGCHEKSHRLDLFSQLNVFPTAVNRYLKFGHLITENHKYLDQFLEYANQII